MENWHQLTTCYISLISICFLDGDIDTVKDGYLDLLCMCLIRQHMNFFTPLSFVVTDHTVAVTIEPLAGAVGIGYTLV
jgi:hypothetical protein